MRSGALTVAALGGLIALLYLAKALTYDRGNLDDPGPGLYPLAVGVLWLIGAIGTALEASLGAWRGRRGAPGDPVRTSSAEDAVAWPTGAARWRMVALIAVSLAYVFLLPWAGHPVAAAVVTLVALEVMGLDGWPLKLGLAAVAGIGSHWLFAVVLGVPLPRGIWFGG